MSTYSGVVVFVVVSSMIISLFWPVGQVTGSPFEYTDPTVSKIHEINTVSHLDSMT